MSYNIRRTITTNSIHETSVSSSKGAIDCICRPMTETEIREAQHVDAGEDRMEALISDPTTGERIWDGTVVDGDAAGYTKARITNALALWEAYKVMSTTGNPVHIEAANEIARARGWAILKAPEYPSVLMSQPKERDMKTTNDEQVEASPRPGAGGAGEGEVAKFHPVAFLFWDQAAEDEHGTGWCLLMRGADGVVTNSAYPFADDALAAAKAAGISDVSVVDGGGE